MPRASFGSPGVRNGAGGSLSHPGPSPQLGGAPRSRRPQDGAGGASAGTASPFPARGRARARLRGVSAVTAVESWSLQRGRLLSGLNAKRFTCCENKISLLTPRGTRNRIRRRTATQVLTRSRVRAAAGRGEESRAPARGRSVRWGARRGLVPCWCAGQRPARCLPACR